MTRWAKTGNNQNAMLAHMDGLGRVDPRAALIKREAGILYVLVAAIIPAALIPAIITLVQTGAEGALHFLARRQFGRKQGNHANRAQL